MNFTGKKILVVDDEFDLREIITSEFEFQGAIVFQAENVTAAVKILENEEINLVISDIRMPGATGVDLLDMMKVKNVAIPPIVLITGFADITLEDAFNRGAEALINKPFKLDDLIETSSRLLLTPDIRWNQKVEISEEKLEVTFKGTLSESIKRGDILLGRGGMSVHIDGNRERIDLNDMIQFEFKFDDVKISGAGVCRWVRGHESESHARIYLGLEFHYLQAATLEFVSSHVGQNKILPFIPAQPQR